MVAVTNPIVLWLTISISIVVFITIVLLLVINYSVSKERRRQELFLEQVAKYKGFQPYKKSNSATERLSSPSDDLSPALPNAMDDFLLMSKGNFTFQLPQPLATRPAYLATKSTVGSINPDIYFKLQNEKILELCHSSHLHLGTMDIGTVYDRTSDNLMVSIYRVTDILGIKSPAEGKYGDKRHVLVRMYLIPDNLCQQTKTYKTTTSTVTINESFVYEMNGKSLIDRQLILSVYNIDSHHHIQRHSLGHAKVSLQDLEMTKEMTHKLILESLGALHDKPMGQIELTFIYEPDSQKITIYIHQCRNLIDFSPEIASYALFVRAALFHSDKLIKSFDSNHHTVSSNLAFNEDLQLPISQKRLSETHIIIYLMRCRIPSPLVESSSYRSLHKKVLSGNENHTDEVCFGRIGFGGFMYARSSERSHWYGALEHPNTPQTMWHTLSSPEEAAFADFQHATLKEYHK